MDIVITLLALLPLLDFGNDLAAELVKILIALLMSVGFGG